MNIKMRIIAFAAAAVVLPIPLLFGGCKTSEEAPASRSVSSASETEEKTTAGAGLTTEESSTTPGSQTTGTPPDIKPDLSVSLYPTPASSVVSEKYADSASAVLLTPSDRGFDGVFSHFDFTVGEGGLPIKITIDPSLKKEAYDLVVSRDAVTLTAAGAEGVYLAVSTLAQLRDGDRIAAATIADNPSVGLRGVIEGFYGTAWTHEFRLDLFDFMGRYKLNTYIYAPKDDLKHRQNWRSLYTSKELKKLAELVAGAKENSVRFVYAVSPGLDFRFGDGYEKDLAQLFKKCQSVYDIGVRDFAIFLDDIDSRDAEGHAALLNDFETQFIKTHDGCSDLIAISPEYQTIWLTKYTDKLAPLLHPDILMMWTGNETLPESIAGKDLKLINKKYGKKVFIWWNYPCNDFSNSSLYAGPCVNLDKDLCGSISGLVSNPMNQGCASMLPLLTIADYLWNPADYDPESSARSACALLAPDCAEGLYDLMDLTRANPTNGNRSSLELSPLIDAYQQGNAGSAEDLSRALQRISGELALLAEKADNRLLSEISPWLAKARAYIDAARAAVAFDRAETPAEKGEAAMRYIAEYKKALGNTTFVSRDVLEPFAVGAKLRVNFTADKVASTDLNIYQDYLPDRAIDGDPSSFFWSDGAPRVGSTFTVELESVSEITGVRLIMGDDAHPDDYMRKGVIEYSTDGVSYVKLCDLSGRTLETNEPFIARFVRLRCTASQSNWLIISDFTPKRPSDKPGKSASTNLKTYQNYTPGLAIDGDPSTFFWSDGAPTAGSFFTVDLGGVCDVSGVRLIMGDDAHKDDYIRKGVIEYSADGADYTELCALGGRSVSSADPFTARYVRVRCSALQTYWVIISEFTVLRKAVLPEGVSFDGDDLPDPQPLFDRDLFTVFSPDPKSVAGKTLRVDLAGVSTVEVYLTSLSGVRVFTVGADGKKGEDLSLAYCMSFDTTDRAELCICFTAEQASIAEIMIG